MKCPLVRVSVADNYKNKTDYWAYYSSIEQCICDYMFCLAYRQSTSKVFETIPQFINFIKGWYCPEVSYIKRITNILNNYKNDKNS